VEPAVRHRLQQWTSDFYRHHAASFDESRSGSWDSWDTVLGQLGLFESLLDVGCGNGRFASFLDAHRVSVSYLGIDGEPAFIHAANTRHPQHSFFLQDLYEPFTVDPFDVVVCFGVMHHIPGASERLAFLHRLAATVNSGGSLALSFWQPRLLKNFDAKVSPVHDTKDLEENDFLLGWKGGFEHVRYCHHFDDAEVEDLCIASGLHVKHHFQGSGNDITNRYVILSK